ncbi:MAG: uptake hydrogenase small subunit [Sulfurospirillum sp.]|jgi:hydrogenase small subunit|nr:uptake hydrogenase small subunit [Sulfurospirillum sp.]
MTKQNPSTIVWLQGLTCNGNSHSFFNYEKLEVFSKNFHILHHPQINTQYSLHDVLESDFSFDFLVIEGALSKNPSILSRFEIPFTKIVDNLEKRARYIICAGSCASFGGIFRLNNPEEITGAVFNGKKQGGYWSEQKKNVINISGCPMHPEWFVQTLFTLRNSSNILLDEYKRPKEIFSYFVHHGCLRNEYFEWKVDCKDFGLKEGCLFYEHGCQGPMTHANCNKILWNKTSSKTRVGSACLGCTEFDFPKHALYETHKNMSLPATPFGISKRAYYSLAGIAKSFKIERLEKRLIDENN